jgi:hypothetical protein
VSVLTPALAARFAELTLGHLGREWPNKLDHVMAGPADVRGPRDLHPIFFGSFDWHSCVHGWWQVLRLARLHPDLPFAEAVRARAAALFTADAVAAELAYLRRPEAAGFERPYGWAWLLQLDAELARHPAPWAGAVGPLAEAIAARLRAYLPRLTYPVRHGVHSNTAFALALAHDWAAARDRDLLALIAEAAHRWFAPDADAPAWEPSGEDFLSPTLCEAVLMARVLRPEAFDAWWAAFLPDFDRRPQLLVPARVSDRTDGRLAHLDGLNLSRAWCWRELAERERDRPRRQQMLKAAERHLHASLPHLAEDYAGEHWLATYALLALGAPGT